MIKRYNLELELALSTGRIMIYYKEYYEVICRKGLLERLVKENTRMGDFNRFDSCYMKVESSVAVEHDELLADLKKKKLFRMNNELSGLKTRLRNLDKMIIRIRSEVKSKISIVSYGKWANAIHESAEKLKYMFSNYNRDMFKAAVKREKTVDCILHDIDRISNKDIECTCGV